jgi:ADP-heptose:LPS heptosyltransferase
MRILVVQTTRMGDVLQTSPLVHEIREKHPEAHIALMVRGMGRVIAERHPDVNEVIVYNEDEMFLDMRAKDSDRLLRAYHAADQRIRDLKAGRYDLVYNVTHSIGSAMLLKIAGVPEVAGAHLSDDWHFVLRGTWTTYFFTSVFSRDYNDLNLCDIFRHFVPDAPPCRRLFFEVRDEDRAFVRELLSEHQVQGEDFVACIQLGASESGKRWIEERFAELARLLCARRKARIFLLGVKDEAPLGEVFARYAPDVAVPLFGRTTVPQAAALLERSNVLITNDTGPMHIAAAVGCPITLVSVGNVHYRETGPYGEGHGAVEWRRPTLGRSDYIPGGVDERAQILPEQVYQAMELVLADEASQPVRQVEETPGLEPVDVYMTRFAPDGCLAFYPVIRRAMTERDFVRMAYRAMWLDHLDAAPDGKSETASVELMLRYFDPPPPKLAQEWSKTFSGMFARVAELAQQGIRSTERLLDSLQEKKGLEKAKRLVAELMALDEEARVFGELNPPCRPLILLARFERDNLEGADPVALARTTLDIYRACFARARLMERKIQRIAGLTRP